MIWDIDWVKVIEITLIVFVSGVVLLLLWQVHGWSKGVNRWSEEVNKDRAVFKDFMRDIRTDIKDIFQRLGTRTIDASSPLSLTEIGERVAEEIDAYSWAIMMVDSLGPKVSGKSQYEIHEFCMNYCIYEFQPDHDFLIVLQQSAFKNGVDLRSVKEVLGVVLRDQLLNMRG